MTDNSKKILVQQKPMPPELAPQAGMAHRSRRKNHKCLLLVVAISLFVLAIFVLERFQIPSHADASFCPLEPKEGLILDDDYIYRLSTEPEPNISPTPLSRLDDELALGREQAKPPPCLTAPLRWEK